MAKVRYKEPSENFKKSTMKSLVSKQRSSVGSEGSVGEFYNFSISFLIPYAKQARKRFDDKQIAELAATIKENGIQNPLLVLASKSQPEKFEVVSGERRLRAAKLLGLTKVPCIVVNEEKAEEIALIENMQRTDLHPVKVANAISSILYNPKWGDVSKFSDKICKDQSDVSHYLAYGKLPESIKETLIARDIKSCDVLRQIIKLETQKEMEDLLSREARKLAAKSIVHVQLKDGEFKVPDRSIKRLGRKDLITLKEKLENILNKIDSYLLY